MARRLAAMLVMVATIATTGCEDSTGTGAGTATGSWVAQSNPPVTGWRLESDGSSVRGSGWFEFGETGSLTGTQRADSLFLSFEAHGFTENDVTFFGRVHADTIDGFFGNERSGQFPLHLVRVASLPSGYATVSVRGGLRLDYAELPGRFAGSTKGGFLLVFSTNRRTPNVHFTLLGDVRPVPGQYTIGTAPTDGYVVLASYNDKGVGGNLDSIRGTLRITRSTQLVLTGRLDYECVDSKSGLPTTVSAEFDVPCTATLQCG